MCIEKITATASSNIALIKYWGKLDIENNIPTNPSISVGLPFLKTITGIFKNNEGKYIFRLNNNDVKITDRMLKCINFFRKIANNDDFITIESENNFPDSCGLASSASGMAALVKALNKYYQTDLSDEKLSEIARVGSGSACRSIFDNIVKWDNEKAFEIGKWDDLRIFNIVISKKKKKVSSTDGMIRTPLTSPFFETRLNLIHDKISKVEECLKNLDFKRLGEIVIRESNELQALCLSSYPPIRYLEDSSFDVINDIFALNELEFKAFYSFDAGPNPFIFVQEKNFDEVFNFFKNKYSYELIIGK
ncbi:diphosphomevalonate decarboxylase [Edhazardia aedis USNM 41457]|uniref:Diphosphomevalonate decarboxylase n=1 Tax=Edhazardia aedis (strain USNM 41457) TaxID=1003232 RepID=J9DIZ2_EDHAE|nr:diphosphomevalonate decarboxylase [Edhazardia aedis USNM 41457]|eukprot:EJW02550.1 diphosphomevalonate decarboxylase [Edhazardia aedis USNM 41457]